METLTEHQIQQILNPAQSKRSEVLSLHNHKIGISGFRGERACHRKPVKHNSKRIGLKLRQNRRGGYKAFFSQTQRSTSYSCPISHSNNRVSKEADVKYLTAQHLERGGQVVMGTFTLQHDFQPAPKNFYDPRESFRESDLWDKAITEEGEASTIHEMLQSSGWVDFLTDNPDQPSYKGWDLTKRIDAVQEATGHMFASRDFRRIADRVGTDITGYTVATEIEVQPAESKLPGYSDYWGRSKNNVHIHFLLFIQQPEQISKKQIRQLKEELHKRFADGIRKHNFLSRLSGAKLEAVEATTEDFNRVGAYQVKGTRTGTDPAGLGGSFWDALRASNKGDYKATFWWQNFEGAVRGRRMFKISKSLFDGYELKAERERRDNEWKKTLPEVVEVCFFNRTDWYLTTSVRPTMRETLLLNAETMTLEQFREWLQEEQIPYSLEEEDPEAKPWIPPSLQRAK